MTDDQAAHIARVNDQHTARMSGKYVNGQKEHGGNCWQKPGMLDHALDEVADLPVYLWTLREQLLGVAARCEERGELIAASDIRFVVNK